MMNFCRNWTLCFLSDLVIYPLATVSLNQILKLSWSNCQTRGAVPTENFTTEGPGRKTGQQIFVDGLVKDDRLSKRLNKSHLYGTVRRTYATSLAS